MTEKITLRQACFQAVAQRMKKLLSPCFLNDGDMTELNVYQEYVKIKEKRSSLSARKRRYVEVLWEETERLYQQKRGKESHEETSTVAERENPDHSTTDSSSDS